MNVLKWTVQLYIVISVSFSCDLNQYNEFLSRCQLRFKNGKVNKYNEGTSPYEDLDVLRNCSRWIKTTFPQCWNTLQWIFLNRVFSDSKGCLTTCEIIRNSCNMLEKFSSVKCFTGCFNNSPLSPEKRVDDCSNHSKVSVKILVLYYKAIF